MADGNIIVVPDLSAVELTAATKQACQLTFLDSQYAKWNYHVDLRGKPISGCGKSFEFLIWRPDHKPSTYEVREYFKVRGFYGHVAAYIALLGELRSECPRVTIPDDRGCYRSFFNSPMVPYFCCYNDRRELHQMWVCGPWDLCLSFVGFREL